MPESPEWFVWLAEIPSFCFKSKRGRYTARKEQRAQGGDYWIAYVKHHKKLYKKYLGPTDKLTIARLEEVAEELTKQMGNADDHEYSVKLHWVPFGSIRNASQAFPTCIIWDQIWFDRAMRYQKALPLHLDQDLNRRKVILPSLEAYLW